MEYSGTCFTTNDLAFFMANPTITIILSILQEEINIKIYGTETNVVVEMPLQRCSSIIRTVVFDPLVLPLRRRLAAGESPVVPPTELVLLWL